MDEHPKGTLAVTAFGAHIGLPGEAGRLDLVTMMQTAPFNKPGVDAIFYLWQGPGW